MFDAGHGLQMATRRNYIRALSISITQCREPTFRCKGGALDDKSYTRANSVPSKMRMACLSCRRSLAHNLVTFVDQLVTSAHGLALVE